MFVYLFYRLVSRQTDTEICPLQFTPGSGGILELRTPSGSPVVVARTGVLQPPPAASRGVGQQEDGVRSRARTWVAAL